MQLNVMLGFERETKGAVRYYETDASGKQLNDEEDGALIGTLYLRKAILGRGVPQSFMPSWLE